MGPFDSLARRFGSSSSAAEVAEWARRQRADQLAATTVCVTGCTSGVGAECARLFLQLGCRVIAMVRRPELARQLLHQWTNDTPNAKMDIVQCDLDSLQSVREAAEVYNKTATSRRPLHVLLLNAGVALPAKIVSKDGLDRTFAVNHLGHFYLTKLLLPTMRKTDFDDKRIVVVASLAHRSSSISAYMRPEDLTESLVSRPNPRTRWFYWGMVNYGTSKLYNIWFANELAERLKEDGISVSSLHPGVIYTGLSRNSAIYDYFNWFVQLVAKSVEQGAATSMFCCVAPEVKGLTGYYYSDCWVADPSHAARNKQLSAKFWHISEQLIEKFENKQLATEEVKSDSDVK